MIAPARTSHLLIIVLLLFALAAITSQVAAQSPRATTSVSVDREGDTIGDRITIRVTVTYPTTSELVILSMALDLGLLEPAVPQVTARSLGGEERHLTFELQTRAFLVGLIQVQLPNLQLVDQSGTAFELELPSSTIEVISVLPLDLADVTPKPLKAAEQIGGAPTALEFIVGPIVAVATLLLLAPIFIRRRRQPTIIATQPPPDPAIAALAELTAVGESDLLPARLDEFTQRIDSAIRRFLEARYHLPALNLTASELTHQLSAAGVPAGTVRQISTLCAETDAVAYAGATPPMDRARRYLNLAHFIVQPLTPVSTPFATPTAAPTGSHWSRPSQIDDAPDTTATDREGGDDAFRRP